MRRPLAIIATAVLAVALASCSPAKPLPKALLPNAASPPPAASSLMLWTRLNHRVAPARIGLMKVTATMTLVRI